MKRTNVRGVIQLTGLPMDAISLPGSFAEVCGRLALATLLGAIVGINRELGKKPAGLRTHALVALGAAVAALTSLHLNSADGLADSDAVSRVIQGIVTGVGFIGAGVILHRDDPRGVHGLTTAASIWVVAAVGVASGLGLWRIGVASVLLLLLVFTIGGPLDRALRRWQRTQSGPVDDD
jgi:putative Mg2+ transporter-C (MgtC) family protein